MFEYMRKVLLLFVVFFISMTAFAQLEVKKGSFKEVAGFVNINLDKMYDDNDKPYAVLKIKTENINDKQRRELSFGGDAQTFFEEEYKDGEVWLYISYYATYLKISHPDLSSTEFWFPFDMQPKKGYELKLINKPPVDEDLLKRVEMLEHANASQAYGVGYITVKSSPKGADVYIDNVRVGVTPYLSESLNVGNHKVSVELDGYDQMAKRVDIELNKEKEVFFELYAENSRQKRASSSNEGVAKIKAGLKSGKFSISKDKQVYFSKGNLQYQAATNTWRFAEHQWDMLGKDNKLISNTNYEWIDLFGWGTGNDPTKHNIAYKEYAYFDWGTNIISNGGYVTNLWRALTKDEWEYLIKKRQTESGIRFAKAQINGVNGLLVLPDNWDESFYALRETNKTDSKFTSNIISLIDWKRVENAGAVFLPAAGIRDVTLMSKIGTRGCYWSKTYEDSQDAYFLWIGEKDVNPVSTMRRYTGASVRLVCDAE